MGDIYTYGVIEQESIELDRPGVAGGETIYTVDQRPFSAIVSDIEGVEPEESEENLRAHSEVLQEVLQYDGGRPVVPMRFGMVFSGPSTLKNVLRGSRAAFRRALREIDGAVELGVKAIADADSALAQPAIEAAAADQFEGIARSVAENEDFSDRLLLNRAYLVDREDREAFDDAVAAFDASYDGLTVQYSGPWAPFNFVDINIGATA